ncbi:hypothetical protein [Mycobacteroides abscessus]|uniref:hypothetical protein n=1 Tax=Mycobacteroides abscessus TaxID=36809 RepID=UPI0010427F8D|nr:hypothetical protein [Mycobacteroides abscessus]MDO3333387.1 hypothetical protein [Mycobacteroides abscessus subsp. bolletii]QSM89861.1 hypothetical protein I3U44_03790 [Mycobacteroides abscessus subsp. bolletii]
MTLGDLFQIDLLIGVVGCAGGVILGLKYPERLVGVVSVTAGVVGVVIGAVIAGVAIQSAFMDQSFLRKLRAINRDPVTYLTPFLFTSVIGIFALLGLLALSAIPASAPAAVLATLGGFVGLLSCWAVASLLPGMATLIQFVGLRQDAIDVPDDVDIKPMRANGTSR